MEKRNGFKGKKVLVLGLAKSGLAAAESAYIRLGHEVVVNDSSPDVGMKKLKALRSKGIVVICGGHPDDILDNGL